MVGDGLWRAHNKAAMLNAFCTDQAVRQLLDVFRLATKHDHFQAILVVEVGVESRNDDCVTLVLKIGKLFREQPSVMIVDEGYRANDKRISSDNH